MSELLDIIENIVKITNDGRKYKCLVHQYRYFARGWDTKPVFEEHECSGNCGCSLVHAEYDEGMYQYCDNVSEGTCELRFCNIENCICGQEHNCYKLLKKCDCEYSYCPNCFTNHTCNN